MINTNLLKENEFNLEETIKMTNELRTQITNSLEEVGEAIISLQRIEDIEEYLDEAELNNLEDIISTMKEGFEENLKENYKFNEHN